MNRAVTALDRFAVLLLGLILLALGAGLLLWNTGLIPGAPAVITAPGLVTAAGSAWWPWVTAACGVLLVLAGLRWLMSHGRATRTRRLILTGSGTDGQLTADLGSVANAAAAKLESNPAVRSAKARAVLDRGRPSIQLEATAASPDTVALAVAAVDEIAETAATMLADAIPVRTRLHVDTKHRRERHLL